MICSRIIIQKMGNIPCCSQQQKQNKAAIIPNDNHPSALTPKSKQTKLPEGTPVQSDRKRSIRHAQTMMDLKIVKQKAPRGPENYQFDKYLGKGSFGCVVLASQKSTGRKFAMKIIQKSKIQEYNVLQCQLIQKIGRQQFLINVKETFQNQVNIYIIMDYTPMGDLYFYLKRKDIVFSETVIKNIIAEIVIGVGVLHKFGIIYRELKPQNLLITDEGHIKLTDYGLSKMLKDETTMISTFVGAIEYMAPEALEGQFNQKADLWSVGVLMYELMFKENPFQSERRIGVSNKQFKEAIEKNIIYQKINSKIGYMTSNYRDLMMKLLQKDPQKRIGLQQVRQHDFLKEISWQLVQKRQNEAPLKQIIKNHDYIRFRDVNSQEYIRRQIAKHRNSSIDYEITLHQFRNSQ